jgi:type I restriction enzyme S subunit
MTALVTKHLQLVAGAPDGIKLLRQLVIDLAIRGRLVTQNSADGLGEDLLRAIDSSRLALVRSGAIRPPKDAPEVSIQDQPFSLPASWCWTRLGRITNFGSTTKEVNIPEDAWLLDLEDIEKYSSRLLKKARFADRQSLSDKNAFNDGDVLYCKLRPYLNKVIVADERGYCTTEILPFRCYGDWVPHYFKYALKSSNFLNYVNAKSYGMKMPRLGTEDGRMALFPLPPVAEQHRIVAKVDELMALCDRLEADQADAEPAHAQLVQALLDSLTQATDAADFRASWQRLFEHFHTLFTTEVSIDALKQAVLQLAVMGKLVPQQPSDQPALAFLQHNEIFAAEHTSLRGWAVTELGKLGKVVGGATPSKANAAYWVGDIPWVSPKDMKQPVISDAEDHVSSIALEGSSLKAIPSRSILMVVRGMILAHSFPVAITSRTVTINQDMKALMPPPEIADYLLMYLQASKAAMVALVDRSSHGTCKLISEKLWAYPVMLPPLLEQQRIVAKVDELMAMCNQLKVQLTEARQQHGRLATALIEQAVA